MFVISWSVFLWCGTFFPVPVSNLHVCFCFLVVHSSFSSIFFLKKMCSSSLTNKPENKTNRNVERGTWSDVRTKNFTGNFSKLGPMLLKIVCNKLRCLTSVWHTKPKTKQSEMLKRVPALMSGQKISPGIFQNLGPML